MHSYAAGLCSCFRLGLLLFTRVVWSGCVGDLHFSDVWVGKHMLTKYYIEVFRDLRDAAHSYRGWSLRWLWVHILNVSKQLRDYIFQFLVWNTNFYPLELSITAPYFEHGISALAHHRTVFVCTAHSLLSVTQFCPLLEFHSVLWLHMGHR